MPTIKSPELYLTEYISAVHAARADGQFAWEVGEPSAEPEMLKKNKGRALNEQRKLATWAAAVRKFPDKAPPGLESLLADVEFIVKLDLNNQYWIIIRSKKLNPTARAIQRALDKRQENEAQQQPDELAESAAKLAQMLKDGMQ
jgi:hypothetical protein